MRGCPSGRFCLGGVGSTPRGGRGLLRGVFHVMRPDEEGEVSCDVGLDLEVIGPFSWIPESSDAPPRIFDAPESRKCGVYLFTVSTAEGFLIYWAGQTSQPVRTRLATHSREFLAGTYNVLDVSHLCEGRRTVLWKGLWWRKDSCERYEEYLLCAGRVAPLTLAQLRSTHVYLIPTPKDRRLLARLEAKIVNTLYADPEVGPILDRGYSLAPRWENEAPLTIRLSGPRLRGLPRILLV